MDVVFTTTILAATALMAAAFAGALVWAIADNMIRARAPRRVLEQRLAAAPLGALLSHMGGSPRRFVQRSPLVEVHGRLRTCQECVHRERCGRLLAQDAPADAFVFCPNYEALRAAAGH